MLRRLLLGAVTALVVARPLVLGEDPGFTLDRTSFPANLVLTLAWLIIAVLWASYRIWSGEKGWRGSLVELGLLAVVGSIFVSAGVAAAYKHPAWLIAWEWLILLIIFCLVRQLLRKPDENRRLLAAILATGVSLSAYAIYQYTFEIPQMQNEYRSKPERLRRALMHENIFLEATDPQIEHWMSRIQSNYAFGTFAHPNAFAGYLALLLPAGAGWAIATWRGQARSMTAWLVTAAAGLLFLGLLLTHSRGGIGSCILVGAILAIVQMRLAIRKGLLLAAGVFTALALVLWQLGWVDQALSRAKHSLTLRGDYWVATWRMISDAKHPHQAWLGVGPGNFSRHYPRYMEPTDTEEISDPHNFLLETWATSGVFAAAVLLGTLAAFFWRTRGAWKAIRSEFGGNTEELSRWLPWEFYGGGMVGLILGFALTMIDRSSDEILVGGALSAVRSVIWFAVFALLEGTSWPISQRSLALVAGVTALLLNLLVSGGMFLPSVAQPLWVMAALAINAVPAPASTVRSNPWAGTVLPLPLATGLCITFSIFIFIPVTSCVSFLREARGFISEWQSKEGPLAHGRMEKAKDDQTRQMLGLGISQKLEKRIIQPLQAAAVQDSLDDYPLTECAMWQGERWSILPQKEVQERAFRAIQKAIELDGEEKSNYLSEYKLMMLFGRAKKIEGHKFHVLAVKAMQRVVELDPTQARFRYQLAEVLLLSGNQVDARRQALKAKDLDGIAGDPARRLTDQEHDQIEKWLQALTSG
jgi:O-antigen ligase